MVPRGREAQLPHGGLPEVLPPYLVQLIEKLDREDPPAARALRLQFVAQTESERAGYEGIASDPLIEDEHEVVPGLIHKYADRVLFTPTFKCAAYCRYCTRGREVGLRRPLTKEEVDVALEYISANESVREVILSGGDPLTLPPRMLEYILGRLNELIQDDRIDWVRIGTRLPIHNPRAFSPRLYEAIGQLETPHIMLHINHPAELTAEAIAVIKQLRQQGAVFHSQSVLLKGVNNDVEILAQLGRKLTKLGVDMYYLFDDDPVYWGRDFAVPWEEGRRLMTELRNRHSGLIQPTYVTDTPGGHGKRPIPDYGFAVDMAQGYSDFHGKKFPPLR